MNELVKNAIHVLSEINAKHLDECSVDELAQLQFYLNEHQGAIFVKTVGRMSLTINEMQRDLDDAETYRMEQLERG